MMLKRKLSKFIDINTFDFTPYGRELTREEAYLVNGGRQIENSIAAQALATPGDTVTDSNGNTSVLTKYDIKWAQDVIANREKDSSGISIPDDNNISGESVLIAGGETVTHQQDQHSSNEVKTTANTTNNSGSNSYNGSGNPVANQTTTESNNELFPTGPENYNPDDPNPDKRYNGHDYKDEHLMIVNPKNKAIFEDIVGYYLFIGMYGSASTLSYDGIGITDGTGKIVRVLREEKEINQYYEEMYPPTVKSCEVSYKNESRIENNQLKNEKDLYFAQESSRNGFSVEAGVSKISSKTQNKGIVGDCEFNYINGEISLINSSEYKKMGFGINLIGLDGRVGMKIGETRLTIGAGLDIGTGIMYEKKESPESISVFLDASLFVNLQFAIEIPND